MHMTNLAGVTERNIETRHQELRLPASRIKLLREWGTKGTGIAVGACVRDDNRNILLIKNHWSKGWFFPGGRVEPDESKVEAIQREVYEETGLTVRIGSPLVSIEQDFILNTNNRKQFSGLYIIYSAHAEGVEPSWEKIPASDEILDAEWFEEPPKEVHNKELVLDVWDKMDCRLEPFTYSYVF